MKNKFQKSDGQVDLFLTPLERICSEEHPLCVLAKKIEWDFFDSKFGDLFHENMGRPASRTRLVVGLHFLKAMYNESDESVVQKWIENPYWQYFCGEVNFQYKWPIDPTTMNKWRKRVKAEGFEELFHSTIEAALKTGVLRKIDFEKIIVDTTVQEKAVTFPTDAKLYHKMRERLVKEGKVLNVQLRRTYKKSSKSALIMQGRYRHARQMKRANREVRRLRVMMGAVRRDLDRKTKNSERSERLKNLLELSERLFNQKREDKSKIYSLHAPEVECIAKGKAHKKYEFGCKVGFVTSSRSNFILGVKAFHGNPYDGHTLQKSLDQVNQFLPENTSLKDVYVDKGYKGHGVTNLNVYMDQKKSKKHTKSMWKWILRRAAIEPVIGHMKNDGGAKRNHLLGKQGDEINAMMMAIGQNLRKIFKSFSNLYDFLSFEQVKAEINLFTCQIQFVNNQGFVKN